LKINGEALRAGVISTLHCFY